MEISNEDFHALKVLEESMWIASTRFNNDYMERTLSPDFFEFGCSGRIYRREDMLPITEEGKEIKATIPLKEFRVLPLAQNVVQVTYISEVIYEEVQICNRSSIWIKTASGWQMRFHQGTPVTC
jgi:hypothetical protein